jgi:hypothetical protein
VRDVYGESLKDDEKAKKGRLLVGEENMWIIFLILEI